MKKKITIVVAAVIVLLILAGAGGFAFYYFLGPCGIDKVNRASDQLKDIMTRWDDADTIAANTGRIALATPISNLQSIRQETKNLEVPGCLNDARSDFVTAMDSTINGYLTFMREGNNAVVSNYFSVANDYLGWGAKKISDVIKCAPFCN
jgi:hypothetical protein